MTLARADSFSTGDRSPANDSRAAAVAFFDLDGTLVVGQTPLLLVKFLRREGVVGRVFLLGAGLWFLAYKLHLVKPTEEARQKAARVFRGLSLEHVRTLMEQFADQVLMPRRHPAAASALAEHLAEGDRVALISAALEPVVAAFCARMGVEHFAAASCEVVDGCYTGRVSGVIPSGEEKARIAHNLLERWGVDPEECWAYADHESDLPLLNLVGHPVAVNPRPGLLRVAQERGWPTLV